VEDEELLRYSRQIMLPDMDIAGQEKLRNAHVLIVGLGGLGSPAALYLAAAGVGTLTLCDHDEVDLSNLQRQIAHDTAHIGVNKATSAAAQIEGINPLIQVNVVTEAMDAAALDAHLEHVDMVLDCTDNFTARYLLNDHCWAAGVPLVSGAAIRWEGQVAIFDSNQDDTPCYRCLYPSAEEDALNCSENGVIAPLVGIIGTCQALEAIKLLCGIGESLCGYILYLDGKYMEWRRLRLKPSPSCPNCAA